MKKFSIFSTATGSLLLLAGLATIYIGILELRKSHQSVYWPSTEGRIVQSSVSKKIYGTKTVYEPNISFQYLVFSMPLTANSVRPIPIDSPRIQDIEEVVQFYPVGKTVEVFYDPKIPRRAVLEPGSSNKGNFIFALGLAILGLGTVSFFIRKK